MKLFDEIKEKYKSQLEEMSIEEYLKLAKKDPTTYHTAHQRILKSIGEPEIIDTKEDDRLRRIFFGKKIKRYPAFSEFFGMEETIEQIVNFFKHGAQGLEERKQILYLLGPVGGGKSSLAERIKQLMEETSIYCLKAGDEISPVFESPLGLFSDYKGRIEEEYNIPKRYMPACMSPWAIKRLEEFEGDISKFRVVKLKLSIQQQIGISKTEPGDENNQDISSLVGKTDLRKLDRYSQHDPDSYSFNGALCKSNQGVMEFVEMFKAPIKMLHPLLTATQEGNYMGTEAVSAIPFQGIILAHSNESEWENFTGDSKNEAFLDRINLIRVPYCLRLDDEIKIYQKLINNSELKDNNIAPKTLELLSTFTILTRLTEPENSDVYSKLRIYNGDNLKEIDPEAKSLEEYKNYAGITEGMSGISTRFAFKVLSKVYNYYGEEEVAANPIHLFYVLDREIKRLQNSRETEYIQHIEDYLKKKYVEFIGDEIQKAYVDSYHEYGQNLFEKYIVYADNWIQDQDYIDPETGEKYDRESLNQELEKTEKPAGISNPKDFRNDIINYYYRAKSNNKETPKWDSYEKIKSVIEKKLFSKTEDLIPVISFSASKNSEESMDKHKNFVDRMKSRGYTEKQIRLVVDWFLRVRQRN